MAEAGDGAPKVTGAQAARLVREARRGGGKAEAKPPPVAAPAVELVPAPAVELVPAPVPAPPLGRIGPLAVRLDAIIGSARLTLGALLRLRVGTTVVFDEKVDAPLMVSIGGAAVFIGRAYASNGRFAVLITGFADER